MEQTIIVEGKTSTEAIEKGLKQLNARKEDVEIKILENEEKRSFYSILDPRVVKVEMTLKSNKKNVKENKYKPASKEDINKCKENIEKFLNDFTKEIKELTYEIKEEEDTISIVMSGENSKSLIGYRGETINALQTLLSAIGNNGVENRVRVLVDIGEYKQRREVTLQELARKLERTVKRNGRKIILEPMTSYERKVIHTELQDSECVTTYSIGEEPRRKIVVERKRK